MFDWQYYSSSSFVNDFSEANPVLPPAIHSVLIHSGWQWLTDFGCTPNFDNHWEFHSIGIPYHIEWITNSGDLRRGKTGFRCLSTIIRLILVTPLIIQYSILENILFYAVYLTRAARRRGGKFCFILSPRRYPIYYIYLFVVNCDYIVCKNTYINPQINLGIHCFLFLCYFFVLHRYST